MALQIMVEDLVKTYRIAAHRDSGRMTMNDLRLYFRYIGISVRSQMQYRVSFLLQSAGACLVAGIEFIGVWVLFNRFCQLRGWSLAEVAVFYGVISITFAIADAFARGVALSLWKIGVRYYRSTGS